MLCYYAESRARCCKKDRGPVFSGRSSDEIEGSVHEGRKGGMDGMDGWMWWWWDGWWIRWSYGIMRLGQFAAQGGSCLKRWCQWCLFLLAALWLPLCQCKHAANYCYAKRSTNWNGAHRPLRKVLGCRGPCNPAHSGTVHPAVQCLQSLLKASQATPKAGQSCAASAYHKAHA